MELFPFQSECLNEINWFEGRVLLALDMGCISGNAVIVTNRAGKTSNFTLRDAYRLFQKRRWVKPWCCRALKGDRFGQHLIKDILYKGMRPVICVSLNNGKTIDCTTDHKIGRPYDVWTPAIELCVGDEVLTNGRRSYVGADNPNWKGGKFVDPDGYVRVSSRKDHPRSNTAGQVYEHILVAEEMLGRFVGVDEHIHHINGDKTDNRQENLEVLSPGEHSCKHDPVLHLDGGSTINGGFVFLIPKTARVVSIEPVGQVDVYDVVMDDPWHNFVANGIVVHNCGKTVIALSYLLSRTPAIVVCPASVKYMWQAEAKRLFGLGAMVLEGQRPFSIGAREVSPSMVIVNYDILRFWVPWLRELKAHTVVLDECQFLANRTKRTTAAKQVCRGVPEVLALSGTPLVNRPIELWNVLEILRPDVFCNRWKFIKSYCDPRLTPWGWEYKGATNLDQLHKHLMDFCMIRRRKVDVLKDLPEKLRQVVPLPISNRAEYLQASNDFLDWLRKQDPAAAYRAAKAEAMTRITYLLMLAAKLKMPFLLDWINDWLSENDEKLVVFGIHREIISQIREGAKTNSVVIDGSVSPNKRPAIVEQFIADNKVRLFLGNIQAAGTGLDKLQYGSHTVVMGELTWRPGDHVQAEDRLHRIGTKDTVWSYWLVARGTIEERLCQVLQSKQGAITNVLDGEKNGKTLGVFDELMRGLSKENERC